MLRKYAPGKVRYTLPALYSKGNALGLLQGGKYWYEDGEDEEGTVARSPEDHAAPHSTGSSAEAQGDHSHEDASTKSLLSSRWDIESAQNRDLQLLALPTLGIHIAGVENWLQWEVRYRKVDLDFLAQGNTDYSVGTRANLRIRRRRPSLLRRQGLAGLTSMPSRSRRAQEMERRKPSKRVKSAL